MHYNDVQRPTGLQDEAGSKLLHPYLLLAEHGRHLDIMLGLALAALTVETIFL